VTFNASISRRSLLPSQSNIGSAAIRVLLPGNYGAFAAQFTPRGLAGLSFPNSKSSGLAAEEAPEEIRELVGLTKTALDAALRGGRIEAYPPFDWTGATEFQQRVWEALCSIPVGATATYGSIARELGSPGAARAVGAACGANPIPVIVPCHRVLAGGGRLGGFSGGLPWKRRLLAIEAAAARFQLQG
jgi:methylated-DNA-[protein]-cysteine S-methyltransferase